jgi:CheY-like chemotaxis protein
LNILVVEDNQDMAESLAQVLRLHGHKVDTAAEGKTALAKAQMRPPDVVLLDIGLPGMDGYEVARCLRRMPGHEKIALVALTGFGQEQDRRLARELGFLHHLVKPVDPPLLCRILAEIRPSSPR